MSPAAAAQRGRRARPGFTLIEIMIVVLILGVLLAIGYPLYQQQVRESRRAEAKEALQRVMQAQEQYRTEENEYTTDLDGDLGFANDPVRSEPGDWYRVDAQAGACGNIDRCVLLTATAQDDQTNDACGNFTLDSRGIRGVTGGASVENCW